MAIVTNRYVEALYDLTQSKEKKEQTAKKLKEITKLFNSNEEFRKTLLDPRIEHKVKIEILEEIISESDEKVFINFLKILIKENRINLLNEISEEYEKMLEDFNKELSIKIVVAQPIEQEQINKIVEKYKKLYNVNNVKYELEIDKEILGGAKVVVGNTVYDGSIKTKLQQMF